VPALATGPVNQLSAMLHFRPGSQRGYFVVKSFAGHVQAGFSSCMPVDW
jgi:hypothetical protein